MGKYVTKNIFFPGKREVVFENYIVMCGYIGRVVACYCKFSVVVYYSGLASDVQVHRQSSSM